MEAKELRIGNYVIEKNKEKQMYSVSNHNAKNYSEIYPIPLNEKWLLDFGFEKKVFNSDIYNGVEYNLELNGLILNYCDDFSLTIHLERKDFGFLPDLNLFKNVHQIQNLYFALTGKELTIKNQE
jgi:hypothetical protein